MTHDETLWLAGWLEGEGYFGLSKGSILVSAGSTDLDVLTKISKLFDASINLKKPTELSRKQFYITKVTGEKAEHFMRLVLPYMGERRSQKINELLAWRASGPERRAEAMRRKWADPEMRARMTANMKKTRSAKDPADLSQAAKDVWAKPENREKIVAGMKAWQKKKKV